MLANKPTLGTKNAASGISQSKSRDLFLPAFLNQSYGGQETGDGNVQETGDQPLQDDGNNEMITPPVLPVTGEQIDFAFLKNLKVCIN